MNQLFHQLQSVVIPSIIDDIRSVHSVSYERSWTSRARYWFSQFKRIKWVKRSGIVNNKYHAREYHHRSYQSDRRNYNVKDEFEVTNNVNVKSELVVKPKALSLGKKTVKSETILQVQSEDISLRKQVTNMQPEKPVQTMSTIVEKTMESEDSNNVLVVEKIVEVEHQEIGVESQDKVDADKECESDNLSSSFVIIEPNISVVTVPDDDNNDSSNNANPPEGDNKN